PRSLLPPPCRRWHADQLLECAAEGRLRLIANISGYACEICFAARQKLGGNLHPPFGEVVHRWNAYELCKAFGENRARHAGFSCQFVNGPVTCRSRVHHRDHLANKRITQTRQPAGVLRWKGFEIAAHDVDEQQLTQLGENATAAGMLPSRFRHRKSNELTDPVGSVVPGVARLDHRRKALEKRIERPCIA